MDCRSQEVPTTRRRARGGESSPANFRSAEQASSWTVSWSQKAAITSHTWARQRQTLSFGVDGPAPGGQWWSDPIVALNGGKSYLSPFLPHAHSGPVWAPYLHHAAQRAEQQGVVVLAAEHGQHAETLQLGAQWQGDGGSRTTLSLLSKFLIERRPWDSASTSTRPEVSSSPLPQLTSTPFCTE
jgi:hypothetical protein